MHWNFSWEFGWERSAYYQDRKGGAPERRLVVLRLRGCFALRGSPFAQDGTKRRP